MTNEQRIRGADAGFDMAILVTGYSQDALMELMQADLASAQLEKQGAAEIAAGLYRMEYSIIARELDA